MYFCSDDLADQLYWASHDGRDQKVLELLQRGISPNNDNYFREIGGLTPLHRACQYNHIYSAELLIKFGAIVGATDQNKYTPLHHACLNHPNKATVQLLLEHGCPAGEHGSHSVYLVGSVYTVRYFVTDFHFRSKKIFTTNFLIREDKMYRISLIRTCAFY